MSTRSSVARRARRRWVLRPGRRSLVVRVPPIVLASFLAAVPAAAQDAAPGGAAETSPERLLSDEARISLVTILPGRLVYNLFGHNAVRVSDPVRGIDVTYNYGTFHFGNPLAFTAKFVYGDLNYRLARGDYDRMVAYYPAVEGRPLIEQWLDLEPGEKEEIFRFLEWNALPENAFYRYDFYYDNCATRIRDLLERVLGVPLGSGTPDPGVTMRQLLDPYLVEKPLLHLGMDFAQGAPADEQASARDAMFLPNHLAEWLARARRTGPRGDVALVAHTDSIGWTAARVERRTAPPWPTVCLALLLGFTAALTVRDVRAGARPRLWLDVPLFAFLGVAGLFVAFVWFVSLHAVAKDNINILWAVPTHVALAWSLMREASGRWMSPYLWLSAALAAVFVAGWPFWVQEVPVALALLAAVAGVRSAGLALAARRRIVT